MHTATAFNNLVYGSGYVPDGGESVQDAYLRLVNETSGDAPSPVQEIAAE